MDALDLIERLAMRPHPEGGHYAETWRAPSVGHARPVGSAILYLLAAGEHSHWHRVDAAEVWQFASGGPLELRIWAPGDTSVSTIRLGDPATTDAVPQAVVPVGAWQAARPLGPWTLVGCIVMPAFEFAGFELAPEGWEPPV